MSMLSRFAATGGGGDPYWANVSYLLVGNGANGTTTNIVDSSNYHLTNTLTGSPVISTGQSKYGSGSVYFNGSSYISYPANTVTIGGTENWTVDVWLYPTSIGGYCCFFSSRWALQFYLVPSNAVEIYISSDPLSGAYIISGLNSGSNSILLNSWNFVSIVKNGTTYTIYINGINKASQSSSGNVGKSSTTSSIGSFDSSGSYTYTGYIYDFRVTKGVARYTANFTPPTAAFPTS